jgi:hypothetical protein
MHRLFHAASLLSLLLCIATVVMWVRSYSVHDVHRGSATAGGVERAWFSADGRFGRAISFVDPTSRKRMVATTDRGTYYMDVLPLFCALPLAWLILQVMRRRSKAPDASTCSKCGYDLRATPDCCPECGTMVIRSPAK